MPYKDIFKLLPPLVVGLKLTQDTFRIQKALFPPSKFQKNFKICSTSSTHLREALTLIIFFGDFHLFLRPSIKICQGNILSAILFWWRTAKVNFSKDYSSDKRDVSTGKVFLWMFKVCLIIYGIYTGHCNSQKHCKYI